MTKKSLYIYRDLHCWELSISWQSFGNDWKYDIKLGLKAIPEVRIEKGLLGMFF